MVGLHKKPFVDRLLRNRNVISLSRKVNSSDLYILFYLTMPLRQRITIGLRNFSSSDSSPFSRQVICSDATRQKCIKRFQDSPQINVASKPLIKTAAVLIPLCEHNGTMSILFTLRSSKLKKHRRQVSFPGGLRDHDDQTFELCALRETEEEIGIDRSNIRIWGTGKLVLPKEEPAVMPVIGEIKNYDNLKLKLNPDEVESVFTLSLEELCSSQMHRHTQFKSGFMAPCFVGGPERVWGITAAITHLFLLSLFSRQLYNRKLQYLSRYKVQ